MLVNLDLDALGVLGQEMLRDYLLHGGGLVVLGGIYTLGNGHFAGSRIADLLPIKPGTPFEMLKANPAVLTATDPAFAALTGKGVQFIHRLTPRPGALHRRARRHSPGAGARTCRRRPPRRLRHHHPGHSL